MLKKISARLIEQGLQKLGVGCEDLKAMRRGAPEKMALAWLLKKKTVVRNEWISQRLECGHPANVPGYVRKVNDAGAGVLWEYKNELKSED